LGGFVWLRANWGDWRRIEVGKADVVGEEEERMSEHQP